MKIREKLIRKGKKLESNFFFHDEIYSPLLYVFYFRICKLGQHFIKLPMMRERIEFGRDNSMKGLESDVFVQFSAQRFPTIALILYTFIGRLIK